MGIEAVAAVAGDALAGDAVVTAATDMVGGTLLGAAADTAVTDVAGTIASGMAEAGGFATSYEEAAALGEAVTAGDFAGSATALASVADDALTPELLQQTGFNASEVSAAQNAGWSLKDIADAVKTGGQALSALKGVMGIGANIAGTNYAKNQAQAAAAMQQQAAKDAAGVLSGAATQAAGIQAAGAKQSSEQLGGGYFVSAEQAAKGALQAGSTLADAYTGAGGIRSTAATQAGGILSNADLASAGMLAGGYTGAAAAKVAGLQQAQGYADRTLTRQVANQQPYYSAGTQALGQLVEGLKPGGQYNRGFTMADAQNMPAYQFALEQGKAAIDAAAGRGGTMLSSNNLNSLTTFAEGTAAQYEQQAFNQWLAQNNLSLSALQQMVQTGQISANQIQQALAQYGVSSETIQQNIGSANAEGIFGAAKSQAAGTLAAGTDTANALNQAAGYTASGVLGAGQATSTAQKQAADATAAGTLGEAQALSAGEAAQAGYTAKGVTDSANATANGIVGAANAGAAGKVTAGNIVNNGVSNVGNQLYTMASSPVGVAQQIPTGTSAPANTLTLTGDPVGSTVLGNTLSGNLANTNTKIPVVNNPYTLADAGALTP